MIKTLGAVHCLRVHILSKLCENLQSVKVCKTKSTKTRCTQREQNARLHVTSLSSDIKYCKEDNKIKPNMQINLHRNIK